MSGVFSHLSTKLHEKNLLAVWQLLTKPTIFPPPMCFDDTHAPQLLYSTRHTALLDAPGGRLI